jgi:flavin reductase (DIM6/NTAB) family NADH-FMN oxidoreductase RutF
MAVDPAEFRAIMGSFATGVTVITAAADGEMQGMTANAVTSLSLDPVMMLICIDRSSHTHRVLEAGGAFAVNMLGAHQEDVSKLFARKAPPERGTLRGQPFRVGKAGAPVLEDALAFVECRIVDTHAGGDHTIFIGEVVDAGVAEGVEPLLFFRGQYRTLPLIG